MVERVVIDLKGRLGVSFDDAIDIVAEDDAIDADGATRAIAAVTLLPPPSPAFVYLNGTISSATRCRIRVWGDTDWFSNETQYMIIAHEVFHCFQYDSQHALRGTFLNSEWRHEGSAAWVGEALARGTGIRGSDTPYQWWSRYLEGIEFLPPREHQWALIFNGNDVASYAAIGVYAHFARHVDLWPRVLRMVSPTMGGSDNAFFWLASQSAEALGTYASAPFNRPELGPAWVPDGPGMPSPTPGRRLHEPPVVAINTPLSLPEDASFWRNVSLGAQWGYRVRGAPEADIVTITTNGIGRAAIASQSDGVFWSRSETFGWCLRPEGCNCPNGQPAPGLPVLKPAPRGGALHVAWTQNPEQSERSPQQTILFDTVSRRCGQQPEPTDCRQMTGPIDPCLTRHRWAMRNTSASTAYREILRNVAGNTDIAIQQVNGRQVLRFSDNHQSTIALESFTVVSSAQVAGAPFRARSNIVFTGEAAACFATNNGEITSRPQHNNIHVAVETRAAGFSTGQQGLNVPNETMVYNHPVRYTCTNTTLTLTREQPTPFSLVFDAL